MSTEETTTPAAETSAQASTPALPNAVEAAPAAASNAHENGHESGATSPTDAIASAPSEAAASAGGEAATPTEGAAAPDGAAKKRRRRRKRKKPGSGEAATGESASASAEGQGEEGDEAEGAEGAPEGGPTDGATATPKQTPKRDKRPKGPPRDKPAFSVGDEVAAKITKVMDEAVMLDVVGKALGIFDRKELPPSESEELKEGQTLIAKVSNDGARGGLVVLTKDLNRWQTSRLGVEAAFTHQQPVQGLVTGVIKGGIEIDVDGLRGFAPASHVDLRLGADLHGLIGQRLAFEVVQFAKRGREFVLSRKGSLEAEHRAQRDEVIQKLPIGEVVKGTVRSVQQFGVFVDVGGIDGLIHLTEASHVFAPLRELFKVGDEIEVKILKVDEKGKVWLSRKAVERDPWDGAQQKYARGTVHKGKVVRLQPFGAFIELEPGIDGLLHIKDIDAPKRLEHPSEVLKVGEELDVVVAQSDVSNHKIALHEAGKGAALAAAAAASGESSGGDRPARIGPHSKIKCVVEAQDLNGLQVRIVGQTGRMAKAFIPAMATGTAKGTDLRKAFPVGKELDAKIVEMDPRRGIKLSIKALAQDEERHAFKAYQSEVKQASKFGTFGDLLSKKGISK